MNSRTTKRFRDAFRELPRQVQHQAKAAYQRFQEDPYYPGLRFKQVHPARPIYTVRININYRAVGVKEGDEMIWFWIGSHADYDQLISQF